MSARAAASRPGRAGELAADERLALALACDRVRDDAQPRAAAASGRDVASARRLHALVQDEVAEGQALVAQPAARATGDEPRGQVDGEVLVAPVRVARQRGARSRRGGTARRPSRRRRRQGVAHVVQVTVRVRKAGSTTTSDPVVVAFRRAAIGRSATCRSTRDARRTTPRSSSLRTCPTRTTSNRPQICCRGVRSHAGPDAHVDAALPPLAGSQKRGRRGRSASASESTHVASTVPRSPDAARARTRPHVVAPEPGPHVEHAQRSARAAARACHELAHRAAPFGTSRANENPRRAAPASRTRRGRASGRCTPRRASTTRPRGDVRSGPTARAPPRRALAPVVFERRTSARPASRIVVQAVASRARAVVAGERGADGGRVRSRAGRVDSDGAASATRGQ